MKLLWAEHALSAEGWQKNVRVEIDDSGLIAHVGDGEPDGAQSVDILLPAPANLHSHAFQRAMAGLSEAQGAQSRDSFWTWRKVMYQFLDQLTPDDVQSIAAFVQMEMLESGYAAVGEFHYLHHQPSGQPYDCLAEMCLRLGDAAQESGIGLTLLPVLYQQGGCDGRDPQGGQRRFANSSEQFACLFEQVQQQVAQLPTDASCGIAPHSLRAVSQQGLHDAQHLAAGRPIHIHVAEQQAEVDEIEAAWGARPVEWLLHNHPVDRHWCIVHATQMQPQETRALAGSGAVAGLCPITESNLGDGIFDAMRYRDAGGNWGIGTDSNIRVSLAEELRTLEYSQRLRDRRRAMYAQPDRSSGRVLYEHALAGGAQALQRRSGCLAPGYYADLLALDGQATELLAKSGDSWLDAWLFAGDDRLVSDVWSAGRHQVRQGRHIHRERIEQRYRQTLRSVLARF